MALSTEMDQSGVPVEPMKKASEAATSSGAVPKGTQAKKKKKAKCPWKQQSSTSELPAKVTKTTGPGKSKK